MTQWESFFHTYSASRVKLKNKVHQLLKIILYFLVHCHLAFTFQSQTGCNKTRIILTDESGIISDGPGLYLKESHCEWLIKAPKNQYITLNITSLDTECSYDHLYVYDGQTYDSKLLAVLSGKSSPEPLISKSGFMLLLLYSDTNYIRAGFEAVYKIEDCPFNCSARGQCVDHNCLCNENYHGRSCQNSNCIKNCNSRNNHGYCIKNSFGLGKSCQCKAGYFGLECSLKSRPTKGNKWHWIFKGDYGTQEQSVFPSRTSHGVVYFPQSDKVYVFGGFNLNHVFNDLIVYSFTSNTWINLQRNEEEIDSNSVNDENIFSKKSHQSIISGNDIHVNDEINENGINTSNFNNKSKESILKHQKASNASDTNAYVDDLDIFVEDKSGIAKSFDDQNSFENNIPEQVQNMALRKDRKFLGQMPLDRQKFYKINGNNQKFQENSYNFLKNVYKFLENNKKFYENDQKFDGDIQEVIKDYILKRKFPRNKKNLSELGENKVRNTLNIKKRSLNRKIWNKKFRTQNFRTENLKNLEKLNNFETRNSKNLKKYKTFKRKFVKKSRKQRMIWPHKLNYNKNNENHTNKKRRMVNPELEKTEKTEQIHNLKSNMWPSPRFGHCIERFEDSFYSFGGTSPNGLINGELWQFNTTLEEWFLVSNATRTNATNFASSTSENVTIYVNSPPPLTYCTLTLVDKKWLYLFGGNLNNGRFSNNMFRVSISGRFKNWEKVRTHGGNDLVARLVGHSTVYDSQSRALYVYGGIKVNIARFSRLSDRILVFNVDKNYWSEINYKKGVDGYPGPLQRAFHTAVIAGHYMVIYGGYVHKHKEEELCYDYKVYFFNLKCQVWMSTNLTDSSKEKSEPSFLGVYGHGAFLRDSNTLIVIGGFRGQVTNDVIAYVLPSFLIGPDGVEFDKDVACNGHKIKKLCILNLECGWCDTDSTCYDRSKALNCTTNLQTSTCPGVCPALPTCQSCIAHGRLENCGWCVNSRSCISTPLGDANGGSHCGGHHSPGWWGSAETFITNIEDCRRRDVAPGLTFMQYQTPVNYSQPDYIKIVGDINNDLRSPSDPLEPQGQDLSQDSLNKYRLKGYLHPTLMHLNSVNGLFQGITPLRLFLDGSQINATLYLSTDSTEENLQKVATLVSGSVPSSEATRLDGDLLISNSNKHVIQMDITPFNLDANSTFNLSLYWSLGSEISSSLTMQYLEPFGLGGKNCARLLSCLACMSDYKCGWCPSTDKCVSRNIDGSQYSKNLEEYSYLVNCPRNYLVIDSRDCSKCEEQIYCKTCLSMPYCEWLVEKAYCTRRGRSPVALRTLNSCPVPCEKRKSCFSCLGKPGQCAWCEETKECFLFSTYTSKYQYGACRVWKDEDHINSTSVRASKQYLENLQSKILTNLDPVNMEQVKGIVRFVEKEKLICQSCLTFRTCELCLETLGCGWCYNVFNPIVGVCSSGDFSGPSQGSCRNLLNLIAQDSSQLSQNFPFQTTRESFFKIIQHFPNISSPSPHSSKLAQNFSEVAQNIPDIAQNFPEVVFNSQDVSWTYSQCPDINECALNLHDCHENATCINTHGGYNCTCPRGFTGNGRINCERTCYEICVRGKCSGAPKFTCVCNLGWTGKDCSIDCGCNNHSTCTEVGVCERCQGETTGEFCELCKPGSYGNATTFGCNKCHCNGHGDGDKGKCDSATGRCYCIDDTVGDRCDRCKAGYFGDPRNNGKCYRRCTSRGIILNATQGYVGSKDLENDPTSHACLWIISAHSTITPIHELQRGSHIVQFTIENINVDCETEVLYVYEGLPDFVSIKRTVGKEKLIGTFCTGYSTFPLITEATSGIMTIFYERNNRLNATKSGFLASFQVLKCPDRAGYNRICATGRPICVEGWKGVGCRTPVCPNRCSEGAKRGRCDVAYGRCICDREFVTPDCSENFEKHLVIIEEVFDPVKISSAFSHLSMILPRFGHTVIIDHHAALWVFGGYSLSRGPLNDIQKFDTRNKTWGHVTVNVHPGAVPPSQRYFHATAYVITYNEMYVYGGMNKTHFLNDFLKFNLATESWTSLYVVEELPPLAGHTLTYKGDSTPESLILIGGVNSENQFLDEVWVYDLRFTWSKLSTTGSKPGGIFGHSTIYHESSHTFYIYGGYIYNGKSLILSNLLYALNYVTKSWSILSPDGKINHNPASRPAPRSFHTAVSTDDYLVLIGGYILDRLSSDQELLVYSYKCNMWIPLNNHFITVAGPNLPSPLLGLSAVMYQSTIYVVGGYSGTVFGSVISITIPKDLCTLNANKTQCRDRIGCASCVVYDNQGTNTSYCYSNTQSEPLSCLRPRGKLTSVKGIKCDEKIFEERECYEFKSCEECLAFWPSFMNKEQKCQWCFSCPKGRCILKQNSCPKELECQDKDLLPTGVHAASDIGRCPRIFCSSPDCQKCIDENHCTWATPKKIENVISKSVLKRGGISELGAEKWSCAFSSVNNSSKTNWASKNYCPKKCAYHRACSSCIKDSTCYWSSSMRKCLSYLTIPIQCIGGTCGRLLTHEDTCPYSCSKYKECGKCLSRTYCGWCSISTEIGGLGICTEGRLEEPFRGRCRDLNFESLYQNETLMLIYNLDPENLKEWVKGQIDISVDWFYESCPAENECLNGHHNCHFSREVCKDKRIGYECACASGFKLNSELAECAPICEQGCSHGLCVEPNHCKCDFGYVGDDCSIKCQCNGHSDCPGPQELTTCLKCYNNTMGNQCQICETGFVGDPLKKEKCKSCLEYCHGHTELCVSKDSSINVSGQHIETMVSLTSLVSGPITEAKCLLCNNNTAGLKCDSCLPGYFRSTIDLTVKCRLCNCNGHGSICDPDWGKNCDCKNNTETPCNRLRGGVSGTEDKECWKKQCSKCKESFFGNPTDGHHCYRKMDSDSMYCLDPKTQNDCHSMPSPLPRGKTVFFAVQPKFNNVDIRLFLDISRGGVDVYVTTYIEGFLVKINKSTWTHLIEIDKNYPIIKPKVLSDLKKAAHFMSPRYDLIGASFYFSDFRAHNWMSNYSARLKKGPVYIKYTVQAEGLQTYFTLKHPDNFLVAHNVTDRLVVTVPKEHHNLSEAKFYVIVQGVGVGTVEESLGVIYFKQDQPRIDLFVFFSVFFSCFFLFLAMCVVFFKCKMGVDHRRARQRHVVEMLHMAKRPSSSASLVLDVPYINASTSDVSGSGSARDHFVFPVRRKRGQKKNSNDFDVGPIAVEPTEDGASAVTTVVFQLPGVSGHENGVNAPTQRLAVGSVICLLSRIYSPGHRPFNIRRRPSHVQT